jgi:putative FmdB family regulatory protein
MPTYEYTCRDCGHTFDIVQSMWDEPLAMCPECGGSLRKVFAPPAISFKGSGFYSTDHRRKATVSGEKSSEEARETTREGPKEGPREGREGAERKDGQGKEGADRKDGRAKKDPSAPGSTSSSDASSKKEPAAS